MRVGPVATGLGRDLARDFNGRSREVALAGAVLLALAGVIGIAQDVLQHRAEGVADYKAWTVAGPRCPPLPKFLGAPDAHPLQITTFGHARFAREHGATLCSDIATNGGRGLGQFPICQFDHPGVIGVSTRRGVYWFWAGFLRPATVSVEGGVPVCVIGANQDFGHRLIFDTSAPKGPVLGLR